MSDRDDHELGTLVRQHATRFRASPQLRAAISARLRDETPGDETPGGETTGARIERRGHARSWLRAGWGQIGLAFSCGVLVAAGAGLFLRAPAPGDASLETDLVADHVRSLMAGHLTDVASSDHHTVKPWFQGRLDYSPPVVDLSAHEYPLVGGRLDYVAGRSVAALIYRHGAHNINVFVWPDRNREARRMSTAQGYNIARWRDGTMQYWAISDLNGEELAAFSDFLERNAGAAAERP